ncbi:hypothetical protein BFP70_07895 [Thioclava sp. SK-1]|nr:hypothetical protein BFP70_07895 [Thioclava sp. SK-1]
MKPALFAVRSFRLVVPFFAMTNVCHGNSREATQKGHDAHADSVGNLVDKGVKLERKGNEVARFRDLFTIITHI